MSSLSTQRLIQLVVDERAEAAHWAELESRAAADPAVLRAYVDAMNVHASLVWDHVDGPAAIVRPRRRLVRSALAVAAMAAAVLAAVAMWPRGEAVEIAVADPVPRQPIERVEPAVAVEQAHDRDPSRARLRPAEIVTVDPPAPAIVEDSVESEADPQPTPRERIDAAIAERLREEEIEPSPVAKPGEWLRRASLDLRGRIPSRGEIAVFLADDPATRRARYVRGAVRSREFAEHFGTRWSTLLVGRSADRQDSRRRLRDWIADEVHAGQSWSAIAGELIAARGTEANPPTNFLLAHLNNQAVPATAITARVLMGRQVQCTQCHDHPWSDARQDEFWTLNAFFKQTKIRTVRQPDGQGSMRTVRELVDTDDGGPTYYEDLRGVMQVAYPSWNGRELPRDDGVARREELAQLLADPSDPTLARAIAARMWEMMVGAPLSPRVDDLGPHASVSHPEVLDALTEAMLASGNDVAALAELISSTDVYQRSSEATAANDRDRPETGATPLLSRTYVKPLTAEQIYDSIVVAARGLRADVAGLPDRDEWIGRFYRAQQNEENGDLSTFDGSVNQALALMNGELVAAAADREAAALDEAVAMEAPLPERLAAVLELALGRPASDDERDALARLLRPAMKQYARRMSGDAAAETGLRDVFWACVNSGRFALNY